MATGAGPYLTLHRILALVNLFILLLLVADDFWLPVKHVREIYDWRESTETRGRSSLNHHTTEYVLTASGEKFQIPTDWENTNIGLNSGDTFYVDKSLLFRQPVTLYFHRQGSFIPIKMSVLNNNSWGVLLLIYIALVSLLQLPRRQLIKKENLNERLIFSGTALLAVMLFFFFYH